MDDEVEAPPCLGECVEHGIHRRRIGHVAGENDLRAEFGGQRLDPLFQGVALIGERDLCALRRARLGDTPGNRSIVGDSHNQPAFAGHQ